MKAFNGVKAFGEEQRSAGFEPIDAGFNCDLRSVERFRERGEIQ